MLCCKDPLRATLRTRRVAASERPRSHDLLVHSPAALSSSSPPGVQQHNDLRVQTQDDLRVPITLLSALSAPFLYITFLFQLSSYSLEQTPSDTTPPPRGSCTLPFHLILASPLCTHSFIITGTPEVAVIQNRTSRRGSCMFISLPSFPSRRTINRTF